MDLGYDSVSTLFLVMFIVTWVFGVLVILLSIIFDCCVCCNTMLVRAQRLQERNRDKFRIALFTTMALGVYIPPAINCFITFFELYNFNASQADIAHQLSNYIDQRTWDKVQIWFDCCGVNNYTYWYSHQDVVPDSCCKVYRPGCGKFTSVDQINERGCMPDVAVHVNEQIKYHTESTQAMFALAFCGLILGCFGILTWAWRKRIAHIKCCSRNRANEDDERNDDGGHLEVDHEEVRLIHNVELPENDNDNIDDTIINIENNDVNNDGVVNVEVNRTMEMEDVLDVYQTNVEEEEDDDPLLE